MGTINLWDKVTNQLAQLGLLDRAKQKWGEKLNQGEYEKAIKWIESKTPKEKFSKLCEPMDWDHLGYSFCELATYGLRKVYHPGTDYNWGKTANADLGKPVKAIADGVVTYKSWGNGWGWHMYVIHEVNHRVYGKIKVWSHYAHLKEKPTLNVGDKVKCGDIIAKCGGTGGWSPHLHFELRKQPLGVGFFPYGKTKKWVEDNYYNPETFFNEDKY